MSAVTSTAESKFVELVRAWLVSLPHDLKIAFDAMDDENLPRAVREVATGVVIYIVSPNDSIQDRNDAVVSFADNLSVCKSVMGELMPWLESKVSTLRTAEYKGKKLAAYLDDDEAREQL